ncbi:capsid and scaffold protein [Pseudomonas phage PaeP_Ls]|nr:capsid and scaffold protein [Pseudomonas phage PaeP_Ls]
MMYLLRGKQRAPKGPVGLDLGYNVADQSTGLLVVYTQGVLNQQLALLAVTGLSQFMLEERTQVAEGVHLRIKDEHGVFVEPAVGTNGVLTEITLVDVHGLRNAVVRGIQGDLSCTTLHVLADGLLDRARSLDRVSLTTVAPDSLRGIQEHVFGQKTEVTSGTSVGTITSWQGTVSTYRTVGLVVGKDVCHLTRSSGVTLDLSLRGTDHGVFHVQLQFLRLLSQLIRQFVLTTSLLDLICGTGDLQGLVRDLAVVVQHGGEATSLDGCILTFHSGVLTRLAEFISLPLVGDSGSYALADSSHERGVIGCDVVDDIDKVFALTVDLYSRDGISWSCHKLRFLLLENIERGEESSSGFNRLVFPQISAGSFNPLRTF